MYVIINNINLKMFIFFRFFYIDNKNVFKKIKIV